MNNWRRVETLPLALSSQMVEVYMGQMAEEKPTAMPTQSEGGQMHTQEASHDGHVPVVLPADHEDGEDGGDETEDDERLEISESKGASRTILIPFSLAIQTERGEANMAKKRMMALKALRGGEDGKSPYDVDGELVGREVAVVVDGALDQGLGEARDDTSVVAENATTKDVNES